MMRHLLVFIAAAITLTPTTLIANLSRFKEKHPSLADQYSMIRTSVELEIEHEKQRHFNLLLALGAFETLLRDEPAVKKKAKQIVQLHRLQHQGALKWWEDLRASLGPEDEVYIFTSIVGDKKESGHLVLRDGDIVKNFSTRSTLFQ